MKKAYNKRSSPTLDRFFSSLPLRSGAVKRGSGADGEGVNYETVTYEGYAPHGVALYIETLTDNRNRTGSEVRSALSKNGGSLAEPGAVAWQFTRKGIIKVAKSVDEDDIMMAGLDAGAEDIQDGGEHWDVICEPSSLNGVRAAIEEAGIAVVEGDTSMVPTNMVGIEDVSGANALLKLLDLLDDHDDVQDVFSNADIPGAILAELS